VVVDLALAAVLVAVAGLAGALFLAAGLEETISTESPSINTALSATSACSGAPAAACLP